MPSHDLLKYSADRMTIIIYIYIYYLMTQWRVNWKISVFSSTALHMKMSVQIHCKYFSKKSAVHVPTEICYFSQPTFDQLTRKYQDIYSFAFSAKTRNRCLSASIHLWLDSCYTCFFPEPASHHKWTIDFEYWEQSRRLFPWFLFSSSKHCAVASKEGDANSCKTDERPGLASFEIQWIGPQSFEMPHTV